MGEEDDDDGYETHRADGDPTKDDPTSVAAESTSIVAREDLDLEVHDDSAGHSSPPGTKGQFQFVDARLTSKELKQSGVQKMLVHSHGEAGKLREELRRTDRQLAIAQQTVAVLDERLRGNRARKALVAVLIAIGGGMLVAPFLFSQIIGGVLLAAALIAELAEVRK